MLKYNAKRIREFDHLIGLTVVALSGLEMAATELKGGCIFGVQPFKFVQLVTLVLESKDTFYEVCTYQSDDLQALYGLLVKPVDREKWLTHLGSRTTNLNDIFRPYRMTDFQLGKIESMVKFFDPMGGIRQLNLNFPKASLSVVAAEVYKELDGSFRFVRPDESLLVFTDPSEVERLPWHRA